MPNISPPRRFRRTSGATALGLALVLAGCAESNGGLDEATADVPAAAPAQTPEAGHGAAVQTLQGAELDRAFLSGMIPHHRAAVEMAKVELERGEREEVKEIARAIVSSQEEEIRVMTGLAQDAFGLPSLAPHSGPMGQMMGVPLSMDMATMAEELAQAGDVDEMFLQMMLAHHASAIVMADEEAKNGANAELRALARTIVADQAREIGQMQQLRRPGGAPQSDATSTPTPSTAPGHQ